jgi:hypothetical protein
MRALAIALVVPACFGKGPLPAQPSEAQVVFVAPSPNSDPCNSSSYISSVAVTGMQGFATVAPFQPMDSNCMGGPMSTPIPLMSFRTDGTEPHGQMMSAAGNSNSSIGWPHVAFAPPAMPLWVFLQGGMIEISNNGGGQLTGLNVMTNSGGQPFATGVFDDGMNSNVFVGVATVMNGNMTDPSSPSFPCCGNNGQSPMSQFSEILAVPRANISTMGSFTPTTISTQPFFAGAEMTEWLIGNSHAVFFVTAAMNQSSHAIIQAMTTDAAQTVQQVETVPAPNDNSMLSPNAVPVGLAADETHVVWAFANSVPQSGPVQPGCWIWMHTLSGGLPANGMTTLLFHSDKLSCMGAAIDNGFVYFTIVSSENNNCNGPCTEPLHGDGIARVSLAPTPSFESLAAGFGGYGDGPRRVLIDGQMLYAIDPFAIAKIPTSALADKHDFTP